MSPFVENQKKQNRVTFEGEKLELKWQVPFGLGGWRVVSHSEDVNVVLGETSAVKCKVWQWLKPVFNQRGRNKRKKNTEYYQKREAFGFYYPI